MSILDKIEPAATVRLNNLALELRRRGENIISFAAGEPDFDTDKRIIDEAYASMLKGETHYTSSLGLYELRERIAEKVNNENNIPAGSENVIIIPTKFAIYAALISIIEYNDEVLIHDPYWVSYESQVKLTGAKPIFFRLTEHFSLDIEDLKSKISSRTKAIIINTPNNPTGAVFSRDEIKALVDLARDYNLYIISDEIYEKLIYEGEHVSPASYDPERVIVVNGFSKAFAMTGWRIGYAVANKNIIGRMEKFVQHTLTCLPAFIQRAAVKALDLGAEIYEKYREEYRRRRDFLISELNNINNLEISKPMGTFYLFPKYKINMNSEDLAKLLLEREKVLVVPGSSFGKNGEYHFRISFATSMSSLREGAKRIQEFFKNYN
jgi:aspartate aminotransferase